MRLFKGIVVALGLVTAAAGVSPALADDWHHDRDHHDRGWHDNRSWHGHHRWHHHRNCRTEWHHHHRVTRCW